MKTLYQELHCTATTRTHKNLSKTKEIDDQLIETDRLERERERERESYSAISSTRIIFNKLRVILFKRTEMVHHFPRQNIKKSYT